MCFKAGDKIKRIRDNTFACKGMVVWEVYTFKEYVLDGGELKVEECEGSWISDNFELVKEEKDMDTFDIKDLKTGQRVTLKDGSTGIAYTNCDETIGHGYNLCLKMCKQECFSPLFYWIKVRGEIIKVESPYNTYDFMRIEGKPYYKIIWEKPVPLTPEQIKQQELQAKYDAAKKELEELGKALGVTK